MNAATYVRARRACAFFFAGPGLAYGAFTARMPALKAQVGANDAHIGLILLCFGISGLAGLLLAPWLVSKVGSRVLLCAATLCYLIFLPLCALTATVQGLAALGALVGLGVGLADVAMNTQGIQLEHRAGRRCMSLLHACYSLGGLLGSLGGAVFAALQLGVWPNLASLAVLYGLGLPLAARGLAPDSLVQRPDSAARQGALALPLFVWCCGIMALACYAVEGSVAEWGSLLLYTAKGASEQTAALVFGIFSTAMLCCRFCGDALRARLGDFPLGLAGALLACVGMSCVIFAPWPGLCLCGYAAMGLGLGPLVPMLFSRAGDCPGVAPSAASAVISVMGYSGALFFPPSLGGLALHYGLEHALLLILGLCVFIASGTWLLRAKAR
ncbi:MAG: MFS transporter [Desulfovibrio sp.]|nr:MFS transporter [Desulfovibrio sp.]